MLLFRVLVVFGLLGAFAIVVGRQEGESLVEKLREDRWAKDGAKGSVRWGLLDTTAVAGKLFEYPLPRTTFGDKVTKYTVSEAGSDRLPKWLSFDSKKNLLEGVASSVDRGRLYYIEVTAINFLDKKETLSKDIFVIGVQKEVVATRTSAKPLRDLHGNATSPNHCAPSNPVTMATIIVDADVEAMSGSARAKLLRDFGRHVDLPVTSLRMSSSGGGGGGGDQQPDSIALVAGPGNVVSPKNVRGVLVQWVVGCGSVTPRNMKVLQSLESKALNGSLAQEIGSGIIGWHVTNSRASGTMRRKRLVPHPTATPLPTLRPPVGQPTATMVVLPTDGGPEMRIIPSFVSPSASVTSERPHRSKTKIRHQSRTKHLKQTPITSTKVTGDEDSELPFEGNLGPSPSAVIPVLPTRVEATDHPKIPATPKPLDVLEPSLVFPVASVAATPTRPLTTTSTKMVTTTTTPPATGSSPSGGKTLEGERGGGKIPGPPSTTVRSAVDSYNFPPIRKNSIGQLSVSVGEVLMYTVPNDTFYDPEDGSTRDLELLFLTMDELSMAPSSWIKFNATSQTLYGMPLEEHAGKQDYFLVARDSGGRMEKYNLEIVTHRRFLERKVNHEVKVGLAAVYDQFMMDVDRRIDVATKIAHAQGDEGVVNMAVTRILEGSVDFYWTNLSLASADPCPVDALQEITERMIQADGTLDPRFLKVLEPHVVQSIEFTPKGTCLTQMTARTGRRQEDMVEGPEVRETGSEANPGVARSIDGLLMTTIVPILILVLILAFALVLVCAIWTRKKKGDNGCEVTHSARKGVPVIFADELEEKPTMPSKPLILADERPPVAPPDYDQATASNSPSTPRSCCNDPLIPGHDHAGTPQRFQHQHSSYQTHPSSYGAGQRGTHKRTGSTSRAQLQQVSRNPPPYVSS